MFQICENNIPLKTNYSLLVVAILLISSAFWFNSFSTDKDSVGWTSIYKHDKNGKPNGGKKADLLEAIRPSISLFYAFKRK